MILIIGYGNPLRSDDGIGQVLAETMADGLNCDDVQVRAVYQLTPELVESVSHARLVIFIDAVIEGEPGKIVHETVVAQPTTAAFTHHVTPASLLSAAHELYGALPVGILISIAGASFDYGIELSPLLKQSLPAIADQVRSIIESSAQIHLYEETNHA